MEEEEEGKEEDEEDRMQVKKLHQGFRPTTPLIASCCPYRLDYR